VAVKHVDKKLRVLVLSTSYPLRPESSSGVFVGRLVRALTKHCDVAVLCPADDNSSPVFADGAERVVAFRYALRRWQGLAQSPGGVLPALRTRPGLFLMLPCFLVSFAASVLRLARKSDVIHANWAFCGALAAVLGPLHRTPIVVTLRGDDVTVAARSRLHDRLLRLAVARAAYVVCVAESMAQHLIEKMPDSAGKVRVVLNGVGAEFRPSDDSTSRIVFVGSLIPRKGVSDLIRAFARLRDPDATLSIIGDGPERDRLVALAKSLDVGGRVEFVGQVAPDRVSAHLASSSIFVLPSYSEGRPNVLLEAMACGTAVIATRIDGVTDTVSEGEHAWLFEPGDVERLELAMRDALNRPGERARRAAAARRHVEAIGWTWDAAATGYVEIFSAARLER
jgi:glycosyltransferase involved in cell wall biosynthesis